MFSIFTVCDVASIKMITLLLSDDLFLDPFILQHDILRLVRGKD